MFYDVTIDYLASKLMFMQIDNKNLKEKTSTKTFKKSIALLLVALMLYGKQKYENLL